MRSRPRRVGASRPLITLIALVSAVPFACSQLIGADKERKESTGANADAESPDLVANVPEAGADAGACAPNEKPCNGTCVRKSDPEFGCAATACEPCSLPNAKSLKCNGDGKCAAATCRPGFGACVDETEGCKDDLALPGTCGTCLVACAVGQVCRQSSPDGGAGGGCAADCGTLTQCGLSCVDTRTTPNHCGACNRVCPGSANGDPACVKSACEIACRPGFAHCDGNPQGACVAMQTFYVDMDGDGVGVAGTTKKDCAGKGGAGWAPVAGDCDDTNPNVKPGQTNFFSTSFVKPGTTVPSYDYDCNGVEQERAGTVHFLTCTPDTCVGQGLGPALSGRGGDGVNDYCGSGRYHRCAPGAIGAGGIQTLTPKIPIPAECSVTQSAVAANGCH